MRKPKRIFLKVISIYEIIGGLAGVGLLLFSIFPRLLNQPQHAGIVFLYFLAFVFFLMFMLSVLGGIWLWMNKRIGYAFSFIAQLLQVPVIFTSFLVYVFVAGATVVPYISSKGVGISFYIGGRFLFRLGHAAPGYHIGFNIIAVFLAIWVFVAWRKFKRIGPEKI